MQYPGKYLQHSATRQGLSVETCRSAYKPGRKNHEAHQRTRRTQAAVGKSSRLI
jgi:hypothetical protein